MVCTFFGHSNCPLAIEPILRSAIIDLIEEKEIPMNIEVPYDLEDGTSL